MFTIHSIFYFKICSWDRLRRHCLTYLEKAEFSESLPLPPSDTCHPSSVGYSCLLQSHAEQRLRWLRSQEPQVPAPSLLAGGREGRALTTPAPSPKHAVTLFSSSIKVVIFNQECLSESFMENFPNTESRHIPCTLWFSKCGERSPRQMRPCLATGKEGNQQPKFTEGLPPTTHLAKALPRLIYWSLTINL